MKDEPSHGRHMNTHIQIRNVDQALHSKLKVRAAENNMSPTDYVKRLIEQDFQIPTLKELTERLRKLPPVNISTEDIVAGIRRERDTL